jgi:hypothetical protein
MKNSLKVLQEMDNLLLKLTYMNKDLEIANRVASLLVLVRREIEQIYKDSEND